MTWRIDRVSDYQPCLELRRIVFIDEQRVALADELDELDDQAVHLLATKDDKPLGTARLLIKGDTGKIDRVCVLKDARGSGLGAALITAAAAHFDAQPQVTV